MMIPVHCLIKLPVLPLYSFIEVEQAMFNMEVVQNWDSSFVGVKRNLLESILGIWGGCCGPNESSVMHFNSSTYRYYHYLLLNCIEIC